jgi:hypothetical protein
MADKNMEHPREDDRDDEDDEVDESPVPDPEDSTADADDVPTAD